MGTTELIVEQVLVGFLALLAVALPFHPELAALTRSQWFASGIVSGAAAIGVAYLLGAVFDRLADTVCEDVERHARIRRAVRHLADTKDPWREIRPYYWKDPFPEDRLRADVMRSGEWSAAWMNYLRSRIRLTRGLAVLTPGLTFALLIAANRRPPDDAPDWLAWLWPALGLAPAEPAAAAAAPTPPPLWWLAVFGLYGLAVPVAAAYHALFGELPRTSERKNLKAYSKTRNLPDYYKEQKKLRKPAPNTVDRFRRRLIAELRWRGWWCFDLLVRSPAVWPVVAIAAGGLVYACRRPPPFPALWAAGTGMALLSAWAWLRVTQTLWGFLKTFGDVEDEERRRATSEKGSA